jgi:acyl transferase domain-containing protein
VLKRLSDAVASGDRVLALLRGSAVGQDGRSTVQTAPNGTAQQAVMRRALDSAGVDPARISLVETHGTGTSLGDPIEVEALAEVYGRAAPGAPPCTLGALKTNIGHTPRRHPGSPVSSRWSCASSTRRSRPTCTSPG